MFSLINLVHILTVIELSIPPWNDWEIQEWPLVNYVLFIIVITVFNILNRYPDWQFFSIIHVTRNIIDVWFLGRHDSEFQNLPRKSVLDCHWWGTYIGILVRIWQMMYNYMYVWIMKIVFSIVHSILFYWRGDTFRPTFARLGELRSHFPDVPFLMLTATCTPQVLKHVTSKIHLPDLKQYTASPDRYIYQLTFSNH